MRVLFSCRPGIGHFHPLVGLAFALADAGHGVRIACSPDLVETVRSAGFDASPVGLTGALQSHEGTSTIERVPGASEVPPRLAGLLSIVREWQPDLIVHEMAEFAAPLAAALEGIPSVNHSWGPLVATDVMASAGASVAEHWRAAGLPTPDRGGMYGGLYLDVCPLSLQESHIGTVPRVQPMRHVPPSSTPLKEGRRMWPGQGCA